MTTVGELVIGMISLATLLYMVVVSRQVTAVRNQLANIEESFTETLAEKIAERTNIAEAIHRRLRPEKLARDLERQHREVLRDYSRQVEEFTEELYRLQSCLRKLAREMEETRERLHEQLYRLDNETIAERVAVILHENTETTRRMLDRLDALTRQLEELAKTLDSRLEGRIGSILSQVKDVRRYCLDVRRECRSLAGGGRGGE